MDGVYRTDAVARRDQGIELALLVHLLGAPANSTLLLARLRLARPCRASSGNCRNFFPTSGLQGKSYLWFARACRSLPIVSTFQDLKLILVLTNRLLYYDVIRVHFILHRLFYRLSLAAGWRRKLCHWLFFSVVNVSHTESHPAKLYDVVFLQAEAVSVGVSRLLRSPMVVLDDVPKLLFWILVYMSKLYLVPMVDPVPAYVMTKVVLTASVVQPR